MKRLFARQITTLAFFLALGIGGMTASMAFAQQVPSYTEAATGNTKAGVGIDRLPYSYAEITSATTTLVKTGATVLHNVCVGTLVGSATIKVYNALTATGTPLTLTLPSTITGDSPFCMTYDAYFNVGITVVTSGATDLEVGFR